MASQRIDSAGLHTAVVLLAGPLLLLSACGDAGAPVPGSGSAVPVTSGAGGGLSAGPAGPLPGAPGASTAVAATPASAVPAPALGAPPTSVVCTVLATTGHGELSDGATPEDARAWGVLVALFERVRCTLSPMTGPDIPATTSAVLLISPTRAVDAPTLEALDAYVAGGGAALIVLGAERTASLRPLEDRLGFRHRDVPVSGASHSVKASVFGAADDTPATDRWGEHRISEAVRRMGVPYAAPWLGVVDLSPVAGVIQTVAVRTHDDAFGDVNGNGTFDKKGDLKGPHEVVVAFEPEGEGPPFRVVLFAEDGTFRALLTHPAARSNQALVANSLDWLLRERVSTMAPKP